MHANSMHSNIYLLCSSETWATIRIPPNLNIRLHRTYSISLLAKLAPNSGDFCLDLRGVTSSILLLFRCVCFCFRPTGIQPQHTVRNRQLLHSHDWKLPPRNLHLRDHRLRRHRLERHQHHILPKTQQCPQQWNYHSNVHTSSLVSSLTVFVRD